MPLSIYYYTLREIPADLEDLLGRRVLEAFDVHERFFHFEFFREDATGELLALGGEYASARRPDDRHVQLCL